jgi:pyrroloquinoline-quinone synthase
VASSLTELFAPKIHKERIAGMLENYDFISDDVMQYFKRRLAPGPARRRLCPRICEAERAHA